MSSEIRPELRRVLRHLKLSPVLASLPERPTLTRPIRPSGFFELVLSDEAPRRHRISAERRYAR